MAVHNDQKCRRCSCRNKACQRRRAEHRRQGRQFLLIPFLQHKRRRLFALKEPLLEMDEELEPDEVSIDSEDLQVMRDSVDKMQQQLSRGLRDIQEIRALVKQAAAQRELERREMNERRVNAEAGVMTKRSPYECDGDVSLAVGAQRTRKKRRESSSSCDTEANRAWLASVLHPAQPCAPLQTETQHNEVAARGRPLGPEKRPLKPPAQMSVEVLEQKKMLLPYLDRIEYINCQLRQRGLLPTDERPLVKMDRSAGPHPHSKVTATCPTRALPDALVARNQEEQDMEPFEKASTPISVSSRKLQSRYPRFFDAVVQANTGKLLVPRQCGINWLLRTIEVIYNAIGDVLLLKVGSEKAVRATPSDAWAKPKSNLQSRLDTPGWLAMPFLARRFIHRSLGLPALADQECMNLMYNTELSREQYPQVALFASFLREVYDEDTLLFFLFVRSHLQDEFDLDLAAKEKQAHSSRASGSRKFIATNAIELRTHSLIPDGTKQVFLSKAACESVMQRIFDFSRRLRREKCDGAPRLAAPVFLAQYIVGELIVRRIGTGESRFMVAAEVFLTTLVQLFGEVAEDILAQFKFNDDGESLSSLLRLRDTIALDSKVDKLVTLYAEQERALRHQKIDLMKMERSNSDNQFRVQLRLAENRIRLQEQELGHIHKQITDGETLVNNVWHDVVAVKSPSKQVIGRRLGQATASKELASVLGRFEAHIGRLQRKYDTAVKASMLLAVPWQQQMDELRLRMVIRIQRAYRARKRSQEIKQIARDQLSSRLREREIKLKAQELERRRLQALREKDLERHQQRLKAKKQQEDNQKRELEDKQKKLVQKAREQEATQRAAAKKKEKLVHILTQWKMIVVRERNRRKAHLLFLKVKLLKWKLHLAQHKRMARAARTIQHAVRHRKDQTQLLKLLNLRAKRHKIALKYLRKVQSRMMNRLFSHWAAFAVETQRLRDNFVVILQKREGHWFQRWIRFVSTMKTRKRESAILIQRQYRGRIARHVVQVQGEQRRNAVTIQRVYRGSRGRVLARNRKDRKSVQDRGVETILHRVRTREARVCFDRLVHYRFWARRIEEMAQARLIAAERTMLQAWRVFQTVRAEKRAARRRLHIHSAVVIQRNFRRHHCQLVFHAMIRNHRAARTIQRVFRGLQGRRAAERRRWGMKAAIQVQTVWRRHAAKKYAAAVRTEKILLATYKGDYTTVKLAIANGFWYVLDVEGNSILHLAAAAGHKRLVKLCLRNSFDINLVNYHNQTALHLLLANLPPPNATRSDARDDRARDERVALAEYLIQHGAWHEAPDEEGYTPLLLCASLGQREAVDMLLNHGANTEARTARSNLNAPQLAVEGDYPATLEVLLDSGSFDTGESCRTTALLLHASAERGLVDCVRVIVAHIRQQLKVFGDDILNRCDSEGYTPLIYAVSNGFFHITECLLEADAGPDVKDYFGRTPLHFALLADNAATREALVNVLIQYDADVNMKDTDGDAPLHVSCVEDDRLACTHLLLTSGAAICANALGNHPTHIAARNGAVETLRLLLDYGGEINLKNYDGQTPLGMARMHDQTGIVHFVTAYFAQESVGKKENANSPELELLNEETNNQDEYARPQEQQEDPDVPSAVEDAVEDLYKHRTPTQWTAAVSDAYCMGSIAEWTQYIDSSTEVPFYYSLGSSGEHVYTWNTPVEFDASMGDIWDIVRGPSSLIPNASDEPGPSSNESRYYLYHNRITDELTSTTPSINYALLQDVVQNSKRMKLLRARDRRVSADELSASAMEYMRFFRGFEAESAQMRKEMRAARQIQRHFRARRTRLLVKTLVRQNRCAVDVQRAFRGRAARREAETRRTQQRQVVKIQAAYRGHVTRKREARGLRAQRHVHRQRLLAAREIQRVFRGFLGRKRGYREQVVQRLGPKGYFEWEALRKRAVRRRSFKVWDEMEARDDFPGVRFYCHQATHACGWHKPPSWIEHDREAFETRRQVERWGYTDKMQQAAHTLQTLWRARVARISFQLVIRAVRLMRTCEQEYLQDPTHLAKMGNYVLYLHTITHEYDRARPLYGRLMRVMAQRGPDIPFILLSYGIFLYVTQEEDTTLVEEMILRGKIADPTLVKYKTAFLGFFRQATLQNPDDAEAHVNYAACVQWLYEQYDEATNHYLVALALAPQRKGTMELFQTMLDRRRRIERAKLTPRSRKTLTRMEDAGMEEQFDAFARFRRWQANQAEEDDRARRMALQAEQDAAQRLAAARKIQARYRRRNAMRKVTRLRLEYKLAAVKAEELQQQALYDRITAVFEELLASQSKKKVKRDPATVLSLPVVQLDAIFIALKTAFTEAQLSAVSTKFRKDHPRLKQVNVMDICRFIQTQPLLQERLPSIFLAAAPNTS